MRSIPVPPLARPAFFRASSFDEAANTIDVVFTTGATVRRNSWVDGPYDEVLACSPENVRLDRLNSGAPFLNNHAAGSVAAVLGTVVRGSARMQGGVGVATVKLSRSEADAVIVEKIRAGIICGVSCGYLVHRAVKTEGERGAVPTWDVVDWEPYEISAVPMPADPGAQIRSLDGTSKISTVQLIDAAERGSGGTMSNFSTPRVAVTPGQLEARGAAMVDALLSRFDVRAFPITPGGREFVGMTLLEMARDLLSAGGVETRGMGRAQVASLALERRAGGFMSTSDFPSVLAAVANKTLRAGYEAAPQTFRPLVRVTSVPDFKEVSRVQLGEAPQLEKVNEHGEFKRGSMGEAAEKYSVATYGKIVAITRQVLVNDDLAAFTRIPRAFGVQASALESDLVWGIITGNPAMGDGTTLFHADHKNVGAGGAISAANVGAGRQAMRVQTGVDGKTLLNIVPAYIIGPTALESAIEQFLAPIVPTKTSDAVPASLKKLVPITEPRLDVASASNWFLGADPAMIDVIELAYLEGTDGLFTETKAGFEIDGIEVKVRMDVGAKAIDHRGLWRNG